MSQNPEKLWGVTKTVYSYRFPETEELFAEICTNEQDVLKVRHQEAWKKKQDWFHLNFLEDWRQWVEPTGFEIPFDDLPHFYPTAGSSEAIREVLAFYGSCAKAKPYGPPPTIHIFEGEYEGYKALATPYGIRVITWQDLKHLRRGLAHNTEYQDDLFFYSYPNSKTGNIGEDLTPLCKLLSDNGMRLALDLCYVGCVPEAAWQKGHKFTETYLLEETLDYVFFSLSKVFGVYYNRIGGVLCADPLPGLWGNRWFKNLDSLYFGQRLMQKYGVFDLPNKYEAVAEEALENLLNNHPWTPQKHFQKSDVLLLAHSTDLDAGLRSLFEDFKRTQFTYRICLTPKIAELVNLNNHGA